MLCLTKMPLFGEIRCKGHKRDYVTTGVGEDGEGFTVIFAHQGGRGDTVCVTPAQWLGEEKLPPIVDVIPDVQSSMRGTWPGAVK